MLLDELARCFVQAAVTRLLNEQREGHSFQERDPSQSHLPKEDRDVCPIRSARTPRIRRRRVHTELQGGVKCAQSSNDAKR